MNDNPEWNESYYFNLHDHAKGVTAFMRIGNKPNKNEKSIFLVVIGKDGIRGIKTAVPCDENRKSCAGLTFTEEKGFWHITFKGPLFDMAAKEPAPIMSSMDLKWKPVNPVMDYHDCVDAEGAELSAQTASEHFEQFGVVSGNITVGESSYDIDATGERDMSEGVREWGSPKMWLWLNSVYGKDTGFNATKLCTAAGDVDAGYVGTANGNDPVVKIEVDLSYGDKGIPSGYDMVMHGKSGKEYAVKAKVIGHAIVPMAGSRDMMIVETISETIMNGRTGYGIAELLVPAPKQ